MSDKPTMQCDSCGHEIYSDHLSQQFADASSVAELDKIADNYDCPECG